MYGTNYHMYSLTQKYRYRPGKFFIKNVRECSNWEREIFFHDMIV